MQLDTRVVREPSILHHGKREPCRKATTPRSTIREHHPSSRVSLQPSLLVIIAALGGFEIM